MVEQSAPVKNTSQPLWDLVIEDMRGRDRVGRERYGTPLQAHNGRNAARDGYEEALDQCVYLKQLSVEWDAMVAENAALKSSLSSAQTTNAFQVSELLRRLRKVEEERDRLKEACEIFEKNSEGATELWEALLGVVLIFDEDGRLTGTPPEKRIKAVRKAREVVHRRQN